MDVFLQRCNFCKIEKNAIKDFYNHHPTKCKECLKLTRQKYDAKHPELRREWNRQARIKHRANMGPSQKIRKNVSRVIARALTNGKCGDSCTKYLPYSFEDLKIHLEAQFENWMSWDNYGLYVAKSWDDKNPATWTWSIDHIVPQSQLPYNSMEDENFKRCWDLSNLRPLSSKTNFLEGIKRVRHK